MAVIVKDPEAVFASSLEEPAVLALVQQFENTRLISVYSQDRLKDDLLFVFEQAVLGEESEIGLCIEGILKQVGDDVSDVDVLNAVEAVKTIAFEAERNALS